MSPFSSSGPIGFAFGLTDLILRIGSNSVVFFWLETRDNCTFKVWNINSVRII